VLIVDREKGALEVPPELDHVLFLSDLGEAAIADMTFYYTPLELCCALRGLMARYMLEQVQAERWLYIDSDVMVCGSLEPVWRQLDTCEVLVSPHVLFPAEASEAVERSLLRHGFFNAGLLGLRRSPGVERFVGWLHDRLRWYAFSRPDSPYYLDQLWIGFAPLYVDRVGVVRHPGVNVAYWNLHERQLRVDDGRATCRDQPLLAMHFSGWDFDAPERVRGDMSVPAPEAWPVLAARYHALLESCGHGAARQLPYGFGRFRSGETIELWMRERYYREVVAGSWPGGDPFEHARHFEGLRTPRAKRALWYAHTAFRSLRRRLRGAHAR
jgi:hypothetical protein